MKKAHSQEWAFFQTLRSPSAGQAKQEVQSVMRDRKEHVRRIHKRGRFRKGSKGGRNQKTAHLRADLGIDAEAQSLARRTPV